MVSIVFFSVRVVVSHGEYGYDYSCSGRNRGLGEGLEGFHVTGTGAAPTCPPAGTGFPRHNVHSSTDGFTRTNVELFATSMLEGTCRRAAMRPVRHVSC